MVEAKTKIDKGFNGNLDSVSLLDVFQLLFGSKKTGVLEVIDNEIVKKVYLKSGMIIAAESSENEDLLGNLLLKRGRIKKIDLNRALALHKKSGKKLGEVLLEMDLFTDSEILGCLKLQVEEIVYSLFSWRSGEFLFHEGQEPQKINYEVALNPMNIIMEATRRLDEWNEMKENLPPDDYILCSSVPDSFEPQEIRLSKDEFQILTYIDGKRSFKQLIADSPCDRFTTSRSINRFFAMGLVSASKPESNGLNAEVTPDKVLEVIIEFHKTIFEIAVGMLQEFMGDAGSEIIDKTFKKTKSDSPVLDRFCGSGGKGIDFTKTITEAMSLPEKAIIHKVSNAFTSLSVSYLEAVEEYLGGEQYNSCMGKLRKQISSHMESRRQLLIQYGLEDEIFKLLYQK
ncbi:MAG: DUF4388 domain-containing protein [candidate division Zixibacteria bacterium]|nr:DUF4388 domain-containing protein [candidate division Zixibacteria bacterium]